MTTRRIIGILIFKWLAYAFAVGILFQLIGLVSLSRAFALDDGKVQLRSSAIRLADFTLTTTRFMPHRLIESAIPGQSKATRILEVADLTAQALNLSRGIVKNSNGYLSPKNILNSKSIREVSDVADAIIPIQERILNLLQGDGGKDSIDQIRNVELINLVKASRALLELGLVAEPISGCERPAKILVLFTSNSEIRSIGGLIGQFAEIEMNCDNLTIKKIGTNSELTDNKSFHIMQQEFPGLYHGVNDEWVNSNLLPLGESLGETWLTSYESQFGVSLAAVMVLDTGILAALAESKGGISTADGTILRSKEEIDAYLRNGIYFQYPNDQIARKNHLIDVTNSIAKNISVKDVLNPKMFKEYVDLVLSNRLYLYVNDASQSSKIETLDWSTRSEREIYVGVNNLSGSKFDFYSKLKIHKRFCSKNQQVLEIFIQNDTVDGAYYPDYVNRRLDKYPINQDGVLNQIVISYPAQGVKVVSENIPPFSRSTYVLGENMHRNLISITEFISAGEKYGIRLIFESRNNLFFKFWGKAYTNEEKISVRACA